MGLDSADLEKELAHRQTIEAELEKERYLLDSLLDNLPDYIFFKDTAGRFLRASRALAERLKVSGPAALIGKSDGDFFHPRYALKALDDELAVMKSGQPLVD